jgi:hypothetical protein
MDVSVDTRSDSLQLYAVQGQLGRQDCRSGVVLIHTSCCEVAARAVHVGQLS